MEGHGASTSWLCVDLGNSTVKAALVSGEEVGGLWRRPARPPFEDLPQDFRGRRAHIASVVSEHLPALEEALERATGEPPLVAGRDFQVPMPHAYETPATLGVDRLLGALAAAREFPDGAVVIQAGTALTVDLVDASGTFLGGAIAPGPPLLVEALKSGTSGLEWGEMLPEISFPGRSSADSCDVGLRALFKGGLMEVIRLARSAAGRKLPLVLSGGAAALVMGLLPDESFEHRPWLVLRGLALAAEAAS